MVVRLGVVGSPIAHSLSPTLHLAALAHWGITGTSEAIEVTSTHFNDVARMMEHFDGLSVTMPLKEQLLTICSELDDVAARVGALNSLRRRQGRIAGRNTDGAGFIDALRSELHCDVNAMRCVVRGSGGSAKSIVDALVAAGASDVILVSRNVEAALQIGRLYDVVRANPDSVEAVDVIVNTVPVVEGRVDEVAMPDMTWNHDAVAFDLTYHPDESPWLAAQRREGRQGINGLAMVVHQARHQLEWWFERSLDPQVLFAAVSR